MALYTAALGICLLNDRRRGRRAAAELAALGDDDATSLADLAGDDEPITASGPLDADDPRS